MQVTITPGYRYAIVLGVVEAVAIVVTVELIAGRLIPWPAR